MRRQDNQQQTCEAKIIGRRLQWAREASGASQAELAAAAGVDLSMIYKIERGVKVPSIFLAKTLCHILRISPQYLLWGDLTGVEEELRAKLALAHPELRTPEPPSNPGKSGRSPRRNAKPTRLHA